VSQARRPWEIPAAWYQFRWGLAGSLEGTSREMMILVIDIQRIENVKLLEQAWDVIGMVLLV